MNTWLVDLALLIVAVEAAWLLWRGQRPLLLTLAAGAALMGALRAQLADAPLVMLALLALGGLLHLIDMVTRRSSARPPQSFKASPPQRIPS